MSNMFWLGELPPSFGNLEKLERLQLQGNQLNGAKLSLIATMLIDSSLSFVNCRRAGHCGLEQADKLGTNNHLVQSLFRSGRRGHYSRSLTFCMAYL